MSLEILATNRAGKPGLNGGSFPMQKLSQDDSLFIAPNKGAVVIKENLSKMTLGDRVSNIWTSGKNFLLNASTANSATPSEHIKSESQRTGTINMLFKDTQPSLAGMQVNNKGSVFQNKYSRMTTSSSVSTNPFARAGGADKTNYFAMLNRLQKEMSGS